MARNVLVGVLNWGIGHATRMVPVIQHLLEKKVKVTLASDGVALQVLQGIFPGVPVLQLPGYGIQYHRFWPAWLATGVQSRKLISAIRSEHQALAKWITDHPTDLILSDNRYGFWHANIRSIFLSHQYHPAAPWGMQAMAKAWVNRYYRHFSTIALVDDPKVALAGRLSTAPANKPTLQFIGPLSAQSVNTLKGNEKVDTLVLLSGPEPQRTLLAQRIEDQVRSYSGSICIVGGNPGEEDKRSYYRSFVPPSELHQLLRGSKQIICRAGYSTLMDIGYLGKPALLIPTPGQPEQEYLAKLWSDNGWALQQKQSKFQLETAVAQLNTFLPEFPTDLPTHYNGYRSAVDHWLSS